VKRANVYAGWRTRRVVAVAMDTVEHDAVTQIVVALAMTKLARGGSRHSVAALLAR